MPKRTNLYREIHEQPAAMGRFLAKEKAAAAELAAAVREREISHVVIAARGTSDNAARYAKYVLGGINGLSVALATPSLYSLYGRPPRVGNALVIGISQSGKSPDIVSVLAEAKKQGALTAVLTNTPDSDLGALGDVVFNLQAGPELAVAATKTYTNSLGAVAMLSTALSAAAGEGTDRDGAVQAQELAGLPEAMSATLQMDELIASVAPRYRYMKHCVVIGRGYNYATAFEMALKMQELTYTVVQNYSSADFLHGPTAMLDPGFPVFVIAPSGALQAEMVEFMGELAQREAETIVISDVPALLAQARIPLPLPYRMPEWLSPITAILPGQMFSMYLAHERDLNVDAPRGLKKVTETV
jgi:glucosamine--fructose-6-phosphate aminotransferase (isomerizing)